MSTFQPPPHFRDLTVELPNGSFQVDQAWNDWFVQVAALLSKGQTTTVPLARVTGGGSDGQLTIVNGVVTSVIQPT